MMLTTELHLVPGYADVQLYLHSAYIFMAWYLITQTNNFTF